MATVLVQELTSTSLPGPEIKLESPQALTPEVIIFLSTLCFLAVFGAIRQ